MHGQVVVCPGVNDGDALHTTLAGILDEYPELATVACVPLGVSDHNREPGMRPHHVDEATAVLDAVEHWQETYTSVLGRRMVYAADEYYLLAGREFPPASAYDGFPQHENGIGMARAFTTAFAGAPAATHGTKAGFFAWVDGAPAAGYRAPRAIPGRAPHRAGEAPVAVITGGYGARVLGPLLAERTGVRLLPVANRFFGGNIAVTGLLTGADVADALAAEPTGHRYLLPDVCLSEGRFLDGWSVADLPHPVEVVASDGWSLRTALDGTDAAGTTEGDAAVAVSLGSRR